MLHFNARRAIAKYWDFDVEVALLLSESDLIVFDRMELLWIFNGTPVTNRLWPVC